MTRGLGLSALALLLGIAGANAQHRYNPTNTHYEMGDHKNGGTWYHAPRYLPNTIDPRLSGPEVNGG
jgi:hypothetical protein